jgi:hypothetical protein
MAGLDVLAERGTPYENHRAAFKQHWDRGHPGMPPWLGNRAFHNSHRSVLLFKDPRHYGKFGWKVPAIYAYVWPVSDRYHMTEYH